MHGHLEMGRPQAAVDSPRVLYVGGGRELIETLERAKQCEIALVHVQRKDKFEPATLPYVDQVLLADYRDPEPLIPIARAIHASQPLAGVLSLSEDGLMAAARLGEAIGLTWNPFATVHLLKEKPLMRKRLAQAGFSPVASAVGQSIGDIREFARAYGFPIIIKPTNGAGSLGIQRLDREPDCDQAWQVIRELDLSRFLMEEYLDGVELSVESFSFSGRHVVLAVTDKLVLPNHVEIGHSIPARLSPGLNAKVGRFVTDFLDVVGLREGPAHTELKLTRRGPRIIEAHNRPGGDRIVELVRQAYGIDMKALTFGWLCKLVSPIMHPPPMMRAAAIRFFTPVPGIVGEIAGMQEALAMDGVVELSLAKSVGDEVKPIRESHDRAGHVLATGPTVEKAIMRCEQVLRTVCIRTGCDHSCQVSLVATDLN